MKNGVTLIELLLVTVILVLIMGFSFPMLKSTLILSDLEMAEHNLIESMHYSQSMAMSGNLQSRWGVKIQSTDIIVFAGNSFSTRNLDYDREYEIPTSVIISGISEYVFDTITGIPNTYGTTTISSTENNEEVSIQVNSAGVIDY